jgi:hypothetical protein
MVIKQEVEMDSTQRDPREMTDEEIMRWMQELVNKLMAVQGSAGGACSLEALKNPVRRNILNALSSTLLMGLGTQGIIRFPIFKPLKIGV